MQGPPAPTKDRTQPAAKVAPPPSLPPPVDPVEEEACRQLVANGIVEADRPAPIVGTEGCGVAAPVRIAAVLATGGRRIKIEPAPTVNCRFGAEFAHWVRDELAPLFASRGGGLAAVEASNGYECRGRNRVAGAKLSEHGTGNAVDIRGFKLADRTFADITKVGDNATLFAQVKLTACVRFMTVLGPGSDGYHEDNLHVDTQYRRNNARFCRWQLPDPK